MAISDKLNYLLETKTAIKNALVNKGGSILNTDSFRSYADKINNIQASGESLDEYFDTDIGSITNYAFQRMIKKIPNSIMQELSQRHMSNIGSMFANCKKLTTIDLSNFDTSNVTDMSMMLYNCSKLVNLDLSSFNTSNVTSMSSMFGYCDVLETINFGENFNTSNVTNMSTMFYSCRKIVTIPKLKANKVTSMSSAFSSCNALEIFGGLENLGQAYVTTQSANYSGYTLDLSSSTKLSYQSIMNVINNLYDIATKGCNAQTFKFGSSKAKLSEEEIAIATNKGWNVQVTLEATNPTIYYEFAGKYVSFIENQEFDISVTLKAYDADTVEIKHRRTNTSEPETIKYTEDMTLSEKGTYTVIAKNGNLIKTVNFSIIRIEVKLIGSDGKVVVSASDNYGRLSGEQTIIIEDADTITEAMLVYNEEEIANGINAINNCRVSNPGQYELRLERGPYHMREIRFKIKE